MTQSKHVTSDAEFYSAMTDPAKKLMDWHILNEDMVLLDTRPTGDFVPESSLTKTFSSRPSRPVTHAYVCMTS